MLVSNDWYPALDRDHVAVETSGIGRVVEEGIITSDGRLVEADVLLFGTGFHSTEFLAPMQVTGRDGRELQDDAWAEGAEAYLGITVPDFPNLFLLYGPNTNLGHNSIIFMIESQIGYVAEAVEHLRRRPGTDVDVKPETHDAYNAQIQAEIAESVWNAGCDSWYKTESGKVTNNWPGAAYRYRLATRRFEPSHYRQTRPDAGRRSSGSPRPGVRPSGGGGSGRLRGCTADGGGMPAPDGSLHPTTPELPRSQGATVATTDLTAETFESTVRDNDIVLVDFWAEWCGPCKQFAPIYDKVSEKHDDVVFGKVDTEDQQQLAGSFGIRSIPTLMAFREGVMVFAQPGALPEAAVEDLLGQIRDLDMDDVRAQIAEHEKEHAN